VNKSSTFITMATRTIIQCCREQ